MAHRGLKAEKPKKSRLTMFRLMPVPPPQGLYVGNGVKAHNPDLAQSLMVMTVDTYNAVILTDHTPGAQLA
jgi:hypothetical protein